MIRVYNDDNLVFDGELETFLEDNEHDEELTEICKELDKKDSVSFSAFSGEWLIEKRSN